MNPWQQFCERWGKGCGGPSCAGARHVVLCRGRLPCDVLLVGEAPGESEDVLGLPFVGPAGKLLDDIVTTALPAFEHKILTPQTCGCDKRSDVPCPVCNDGLAVCGRCGKGEADLDGPCRPLRVALTNVVGCIPREPEGGKAAQPLPEDVDACAPRLRALVELARPRLIVTVGTFARDYLDEKMRGNVWDTTTPEQRASRRRVDRAERLHPGAGTPRLFIHHPAWLLRLNVAMRGLEIQRQTVRLATALEALE